MNLLTCAILFLSFTIQASTNCRDPNLTKYIKMDYKTFDQSPPKGGWRILEGKGHDIKIAELIDSYLNCRRGLTSKQKATLIFHSGQIYGDLGQNNLAIERMKLAYNENLDKKYHWNAYVDGSIAFLEHNLEKLKSARDNVKSKEPDHPYVETLTDLIRCFERPYKEIDRCRNEKIKTINDLILNQRTNKFFRVVL